MVNGRLLHGLPHPEVGHMRIPHDRSRDPFDRVCPYHGDCLEGLASGEAICARWGRPGEELSADAAVWELEGEYLAYGLMNLICTLSPQRIVAHLRKFPPRDFTIVTLGPAPAALVMLSGGTHPEQARRRPRASGHALIKLAPLPLSAANRIWHSIVATSQFDLSRLGRGA